MKMPQVPAPVTITIIALNVLIFLLQRIFYPIFDEVFALTPSLALQNGWYWQFLSYMFLHGGIMHITMNMFVLLMFGVVIEQTLGSKRYIALYFISGVGSALLYMALTGISDVMMLGASGAIFGILTAYGFMFPKNIILMFPGIPVPAFFAVFGFAILELLAGMFGLEPGIANFGHLGGIVTGVILMSYWKRSAFKKNPREFEYFWQ
jgi:membrane associated rhomboid family serine protease